MQLGIIGYVREVTDSAGKALRTAEIMIDKEMRESSSAELSRELSVLQIAIRRGIRDLAAGVPVADVADEVGGAVERASRILVAQDLAGSGPTWRSWARCPSRRMRSSMP